MYNTKVTEGIYLPMYIPPSISNLPTSLHELGCDKVMQRMQKAPT